ncbi:hypothetical protein [Pelagibius sp. 7325]|uniref:nickel/cobalt transporter n=1 Tax=Pelagibius sp. 7325 TaxID=3131994 RepID=UPI0030EC9A8C
MAMLQFFFDLQRDIYLAFAGRLTVFAETGDWWLLASYLPVGLVFGAAHAMTPGHSKAVLAVYLSGSRAGLARALLISLVLSATHVAMAVSIVLLSLPVVSAMLGSSGRAPLLEDISRGVLGLIGVWMLWQAFRRKDMTHGHDGEQGAAFGFVAGLIPCPLTLFVMTFAVARGVPEAGLVFAVVMMAGVAVTLSLVAAAAVCARGWAARLLAGRASLLERLSRALHGLAGLVLVAIALNELLSPVHQYGSPT